MLLQEIADRTGGTYRQLSDVEDLVCEFQQVRAAVGDEAQRDCEPSGRITPGELIERTIEIIERLRQVTFTNTWAGSDIEMTVISPSGVRYDRSTTLPNADVEFGPTFETITIRSPEVGAWKVELFGADIPVVGEPYSFSTVELPIDNQSPVAEFEVTNLEEDLVELSAGLSRDEDGELFEYIWDFGDGFGARGANVQHSYVSSGNYEITLTVVDDDLATATTAETVEFASSISIAEDKNTSFLIRAKGQTGDEKLEVRVDGETVGEFEATTKWVDYEVEVAEGTDLSGIQVWFTNDAVRRPYDRNLVVDYVEYEGDRYETEADSTTSTGTWTSAAPCEPQSDTRGQTLHCNGYFQYADEVTDPPGPGNTKTLSIRAKGDTGDEKFEVQIDGTTIEMLDATTDWADYEVTVPADTSIEDIQVWFTNDAVRRPYDRNLRVDYVELEGVRYETEAASTSSTGSWTRSAPCTPTSDTEGETLHCNGYFQYAS